MMQGNQSDKASARRLDIQSGGNPSGDFRTPGEDEPTSEMNNPPPPVQPTPHAIPGEGVASAGLHRCVVPRQHSADARRNAQRVADVMTTNLQVCEPGTELYYLARMMSERDIGAVPVVRDTDSMRPVGIITDRDIVVRVLAERQDPNRMRARDCMSEHLLTVSPETSLGDCLRLMEQRQVRRVPVVDAAGRCIGIVSQADIAQSLPEHDAARFIKALSRPGHEAAYH